ncbi:MFS transporter [Rhodanobacter glycinis]|uniref:MFS transporter n=1 Tax=Rhodanobacter glycinis TaxID=582702 RepID=A0A502FKU1_9GAMM|nr:MFS transporter [Rhodanobacter glycinis]TPG08198.1 MFS transporter [Rhodanobacter glycinis]TPG50075.1 MFS transporter [Rhodanobacter glycinis]
MSLAADESAHDVAEKRSVLRRIPRGIWALGFVSMLMDTSSEMIHALLPVYLVTVLGTSALTVGLIEGIAESTAAITKVFSGVLSDWLGRRKLLVAIGYGLAAFTKPVFPLASTVGWVIAARFVDRIGKGIRGAPRDALIADLAPIELRGASFGLRQSLDTVGAFIGPALAIGLMWLTADNIPWVFWAALPPAFAALALVLFGVHDKPVHGREERVHAPLSRVELARLPPLYWGVVSIAAVFALARFSEAFLVLRAQELGLTLALIPLVLVVLNVVYAFSSYPVGVLADRFDRGTLLALGVAALVVSDLALALVGGMGGLALGVVLWGLHMGMTQGLLATLVADVAPANLRGAAFGVFNLVSGLALLLASIVAGALWDAFGSRVTFLVGAGIAAITVLALMPVAHRVRRRKA